MRSRLGLLVALLVAVVAAAAVAWRSGWMSPTPKPVVASPAPTPVPPPPLQSAWKTEQEWLVGRIARDVVTTARWAASGSVPVDDAPVDARAVAAADHLLLPASYAVLATEALAAAPTPAAVAGDDPREGQRLIATLLDLRAPVLLREDVALSLTLSARPLDASAHERAALLLGAFALRDVAGRSTDVRPALCRVTAHLAVASALRGGREPGLAGRLAEAVLVTLAGRQRDALARLDALEAVAPSRPLHAWTRALRLRNTGDWRIARDARGLTLLERLEEFRALVKGLGDAAAWAWLDRERPRLLVDWALLALDADSIAVETGNRVADVAPILQLAEAGEAWTALRGTPLDDAGMMEALNEPPAGLVSAWPDGRPRVAVVGWGLWADRTQRHLVYETLMATYYYGGLLGRPGDAHSYAERARERFGRLSLYPVVLRGNARDAAEYRSAMAAVRELALRSPERFTGGHWALFRTKEEFAAIPADLPDVNAWFRPALPSGTMLDVRRRLEVLDELKAMDAATLARLREMAPYDLDLALLAAARLPNDRRGVADVAAVYGPLAQFNARAMGKLADAAWYDPPAFRERQAALCDVVPDRCFMLGYRLAELGFADEASAAYQKGFDRANDRVLAANWCRWLVGYYFDHGQAPKAEGVARRAAATGASAGLFALAELMEKRGRLRDAEEQYRRILDRYQSPDELVGFYFRQSRTAGHAEYEGRLRDALALALPSGLEPLDRKALEAPPTQGVVVRKANDNTKRCGINWGNVIVGLDGYRIRDGQSYDLVNALSLSPRMELVVWREGSYHDVTTEIWDRRFRVDLEDLAPRR